MGRIINGRYLYGEDTPQESAAFFVVDFSRGATGTMSGAQVLAVAGYEEGEEGAEEITEFINSAEAGGLLLTGSLRIVRTN